MQTFDIRPFQEGDRETITEYQNQVRPLHLQETVAEWERSDAVRPAEEVRLRLCIGEPAAAYMSVVDRSTSVWCKPDVCSFTLEVDPNSRNQGLGSALYEQAAAFARQRGSARLQTFVRFYEPDEPAARFLEKRGFVEVDRTVPVMLNLTTFDREQFSTPAPEGIRFFSYAEAGDTETQRHKLHALMTQVDRDIPTNDVLSEPPVFEEWIKDMDRPEWDSAAVLLAADEAGHWIGLSQLGFQEHTSIGWTFLTGVLPEHRGRGIAYALKLRTIDAAIHRGCPLILTENHEDNAPMRAINKKLGFVPDAPAVSYSKDI